MSDSILPPFGQRPLMLALASALSSPALAQPATIEEVVVWSTEVRASSIRVASEAIAARQADHISDLLRTIPGVDVGGAHSLNQRITIRSMDDKDLRIRIDGANQNTYMYHHMGNLQIHADILESVDIRIGTNSVIDGSLGGAVNFETKAARQLLRSGQRLGGRVQAGYGDNSGTNIALTGFGLLGDDLDVLLYHNALERVDFEVGGGRILDAAGNELAGTDGEVRGLKGDLDDTLLKFGWDIGTGQRLELGYETYNDEGSYSYRPDMGLATDLAITESLGVPLLWPTRFERDTLTLSHVLDWGADSTLRTSLFRNESMLWRDERGWADNPAFASSAGIIKGEAENTGLYMLGETGVGRHTLAYGLEFIDYDTRYEARYSESTDLAREAARNRSVFLQDTLRVTDRLYVIPGIRYDRFDIDSAVVDARFDRFTGGLALEYELRDNLVGKLSATQLFKGPEIGEVFIGAGLFDTPNADIDEENGVNTELALAFEDAVFGADRFAAGFTLFRTDLDDYIYDYTTAPPETGARSWKDNVGNMRIEGAELYLAYDIGNFSALLTWSDAESELSAFAPYAELDGARLDRQQGATISLNVDYELPATGLSLHWDLLSVGSVPAGLDLDGATLDNAKDSFVLHNVSARWKPSAWSGLTLTLGVDNLFDEYYASQSSRTGVSLHPRFGELYLLDYEPGRNIKATVSYDF